MRSLLLVFICTLTWALSAQQTHSDIRKSLDESHIQMVEKDTHSLGMCFTKAHWEAHSRTFLMSTINKSGNNHLTSFYA